MCVVWPIWPFVLQTTQEQRRSQLEQTQNSLNLQVAQAVREIDALRESQRKASTYRHDLRHHLQYISACIENGRAEAAQEYIHSVCAEIEASKVNVYCENEAANLILSAFATRAQNSGIDFRVHAAIPLVLPLPDSDLCVLLSNALENALHAGQRQREGWKARCCGDHRLPKGQQTVLQIANSCSFPVQFRAEGIPTTSQPGHGLGVRSICAIVEQYGGMYSFFAAAGPVCAAHLSVKGRFNAFYGQLVPIAPVGTAFCAIVSSDGSTAA